MEIRLAMPDDVEDLFYMNKLFGNSTSIGLMKECLSADTGEIVCIAYASGTPAGYCTGMIVRSICHGEPRADIETLFVREECRRQGLGRALLSFFTGVCTARGIRHFHLTAAAENTAALELYGKQGFENAGEILMEKTV